MRRLLTTFFWALTISWSRLLARVWSGHKYNVTRPGNTVSFEYEIKLLTNSLMTPKSHSKIINIATASPRLCFPNNFTLISGKDNKYTCWFDVVRWLPRNFH